MTTRWSLTFDCHDAGLMARFWTIALGYQESPPPQGWDTWQAWLQHFDVPEEEWGDGASLQDPQGVLPKVSFLQVPEPKTAKNRLHLDLQVTGGRHIDQAERGRIIETTVQQLLDAGGAVLYRSEEAGVPRPRHHGRPRGQRVLRRLKCWCVAIGPKRQRNGGVRRRFCPIVESLSPQAPGLLVFRNVASGTHRCVNDSLAPLRGRFRSPSYRRVSHGLILRQAHLPSRDEQLRDLGAWQLVLPHDGVFTHVTAAWLYEWWLPPLPEHVPIFAATAARTRPRRAGLVCSRHDQVADGVVRLGLAVDRPDEVLLRAARDLAVLDLVVLIDCALARGDARRTDIERLAYSGRPGSRRLRAALELSDSRSESAWETLLRVFHRAADVDVEPQATVRDERGSFVARADLLVIATGDLHEYDGQVHDQAPQRTRDLRRLRRLHEVGRTRRGFTAPDLVGQPAVTMHELDRVLGRPHDPRRLERWLILLEQSCFSSRGRARLQNRWFTNRHWSQTPA